MHNLTQQIPCLLKVQQKLKDSLKLSTLIFKMLPLLFYASNCSCFHLLCFKDNRSHWTQLWMVLLCFL